jgi:hypothetical protein
LLLLASKTARRSAISGEKGGEEEAQSDERE